MAFKLECFSANGSISFCTSITLSKSVLVAASISSRCILLLHGCFKVPAENPPYSKKPPLAVKFHCVYLFCF